MTYTIGGLPSTPGQGVLFQNRVFHVCVAVLLLAIAGAGGCTTKAPGKITSPYQNVGPRKNLPPYLKGSVYELVELANSEPLTISSYGLVGQLRGTGDTKAPPAVRHERAARAAGVLSYRV